MLCVRSRFPSLFLTHVRTYIHTQESIPLPTIEALPFLLRTYERAVLARLRLALKAAGEGEDGGAAPPAADVVLSSLLDALGRYVSSHAETKCHLISLTHTSTSTQINQNTHTVSAAQALRPFRLGEAAVWRTLARVKQRAATSTAAGAMCV